MIQNVVNEIEKDFGVVASKNVIERKQFSSELPTYYNFIEKLYLNNIMPFPKVIQSVANEIEKF